MPFQNIIITISGSDGVSSGGSSHWREPLQNIGGGDLLIHSTLVAFGLKSIAII